jgi:hypothetical protein
MTAEMLRSHVTRSSARLAAVEVVPPAHRRKFILNVLQRGHRFLKQFRQRLGLQQTILPDNRSPTNRKHPVMNTNEHPPTESASNPRDNPSYGT